ncbi:MAG TPA: hypothetical protein VF251_07655 [Pyrinomonadaceae bacterium]
MSVDDSNRINSVSAFRAFLPLIAVSQVWLAQEGPEVFKVDPPSCGFDTPSILFDWR